MSINEMPLVEIIMPLGSDPTSASKQQAIRRGAARAGFSARFPNYPIPARDFELSGLVERLREAIVVLADLTGERPSCYYEIGVAEAIGVPILLVAQIGTHVHQVGNRSRIRFYADLTELEVMSGELLRSIWSGADPRLAP